MPETILHVITGLNTGGAERALYSICQGGLAQQYRTVVVSLSGEGRYGPLLKELGVEVFTLDMKRALPSISALLKLRVILRKVQPDLIQGWMYHGNLLASLSRLFLLEKRPVVWNVRHSLYDLDKEKRATQWVIKLCKKLPFQPIKIIYNSRLSRQQHEAFGFAKEQGLVIPNGFFLERFAFSSELRSSIRDHLQVADTTQVVGHVARFHPMKDHFSLIKAALKVLNHNENTVFVMLGTDVTVGNAALVNEIPNELMDHFRFLGEKSNVEHYMSAFDLFVLSSWSEAFPNVLGEAMACGLPCVTTGVGDAAYIVADTGKVVPPRNPDLLASAISNMLETSDQAFSELKRKARERVELKFSLDSVVDKYCSLYSDILKVKKAPE